MKRKLVTALFLITGATFFLTKKDKKIISENVSKNTHQNLFLSSRTSTLPTNKIEIAGMKDDCSNLRQELDAIDFNLPINEWKSSLNLKHIQACQDPELAERTKLLQSVCFEVFQKDECAIQTVFLRSLLRTKGLKISDDKEQLADLILREFAKGTPDFKNLGKLADKLMQIDPKYMPYQKLWAMSKVIASVEAEKSPEDLADEIYNKVDPDFWNDPQMRGIEVAIKTGFNPQSVENATREYLAQKEDSWGRELLGWSLWKQGRRDEALDQLRQAIDLNPKDKWLRDQYEKVRSKGAGADDYQARLSLGVSSDDLFN